MATQLTSSSPSNDPELILVQAKFRWLSKHDSLVRSNLEIDRLLLELNNPHYPAEIHRMVKELDRLFTRRNIICSNEDFLEYSIECRGGPCRCRELNRVPFPV